MTTGKRLAVRVAGAAGVLLPPLDAEAHLVTTGLGPVYDGIGHFVMSPDDLLPVVAMALLAGLNGTTAARRALFVLTAGWLAGGLAGHAAGAPSLPASSAAVSFLLIGGLTASGWRIGPAKVAALALALGVAHGWLNGVSIAEAGREAMGLAGIAAAIFVCVALVASVGVWARGGWTRIAVRVAGSWVAAIGLLMLGWSLRGS